jgi:hypothetical protein
MVADSCEFNREISKLRSETVGIKDIKHIVIITIVEYPDWGSTKVFRKL